MPSGVLEGGRTCVAVVQITATLMACIYEGVDARVCRLDDIRAGASDAFTITNCHSLDLAHQPIHDKGAYALASALAGNKDLEKLYLTECGLTEDGAKAIADVLKETKLKEVYLWKNAIGDKGAASIALAIEDHPTIEVMYLGYNGITDVGATVIAKRLRHNTVLQTLDLRGNQIAEDGAEAIAGALYHNTALKKIHLFNNNIGSEGAKHIERALTQNRNIHTLNVHDNDIGDKQHASINRQLLRNKKTTPQPRATTASPPLPAKQKHSTEL